MMNKTVLISKEVWDRLEQYINQIVSIPNTTYQVGEKVALKKWHNIVNALKTKLETSFLDIKAITPYNDMGKSLGYHQFNYQDKKSTKWYFGFEEEDGIIIVHIMKNSSSVTSGKQYYLPKINEVCNTALVEFHSWMKRLDEVKGARPTFWC